MTQNQPFDALLKTLAADWRPLDDRPEETPESTLRALWFLAAGEPRAVQRCQDPLPALSEAAHERLADLVRRRVAGVPLAHLTGRQCFMGIEMLAGPEALIPRQETEILGYGALRLLRELAATQDHATAIDLCTGCGNLALALAYHEPACHVHAADLSTEAIDLARRNARHLGLASRTSFSVGDLFAPLEGQVAPESVDLIICNPPYIATQHIADMPDEIHRHEPHLAFDGGPFGVSILLRIISDAPRFLRPGGWLCFEVGLGQGELICRRLERDDAYAAVEALYDGDDRPRALLAQRR